MLLSCRNFAITLTIIVCSGLIAGTFVFYTILKRDWDNPVVKMKLGKIQGLKVGGYNVYLGIPYAKVNMSNIFGPSVPYGKFSGTFKAHDDTAICPQFDFINKTIVGTLDCLSLNIYAPKNASIVNPLPVLTFISGSQYGSGTKAKSFYGPKYLVNHDIIVVTFNYRVGPYGFLCAANSRVGNQGFKDQILALKWVKENIKYFGGDPTKVTVAGSGSGGSSVNLHLLYGDPELFQNAIIDSGIYTEPIEFDEKVSTPIELAEDMGLVTYDEVESLKFLNKQSPASVIASAMKLHLQYRPCIEKEVGNAFITNKTLRTSFINLKRIPVMVTHGNKDMMMLHTQNNPNNVNSLFRDALARQFNFDDEVHLKRMENYVRNFYVSGERDGKKVLNELIKFSSDVYNNYPTRRMIEKYLENDRKVYYGVFAYSGARNFIKVVYNVTLDGASRGDMMGYFFELPYLNKSITNIDRTVMDRVTALWANFVKYGDPTPAITKTLPVKWEPVAKGKLNFMEIASGLKLKAMPFSNRTAFWDLFYKMYGVYERKNHTVQPWITYF